MLDNRCDDTDVWVEMKEFGFEYERFYFLPEEFI